MVNPYRNTRCGHNFPIWKCPYKYCLARALYEQRKADLPNLSVEEFSGDIESLMITWQISESILE